MAYLVDTSVLGRLANTADPFHSVATQAVTELHARGELLHITPQNLIEFHSMATRPNTLNGLGLSAADAELKAAWFESRFPLLVETSEIYPKWRTLVSTLAIIGKQVHDARLVAVCHVHAVGFLLTFNVAHFLRMSAIEPGVVIVDPASV